MFVMQAAAGPLLWQHSMESAMEVVRCSSAVIAPPTALMLSGGRGSSGGCTDMRNKV